MNFTKKDIAQINSKGLNLNQVISQLETFAQGIPFVEIKEAATIDNGIIKLSDDQKNENASYFDEQRNLLNIVKFVPASGAATRMFKFLFQFLKEYTRSGTDLLKGNIKIFHDKQKLFPFYHLVSHQVYHHFPEYDTFSEKQQFYCFIKTMLDEDKLNMSAQPKGLLPFHRYSSHIATAFEEHLNEAAWYANSNGKANLHFTVSKEHVQAFQSHFKELNAANASRHELQLNVVYSTQKEHTDTIAVNPDNTPFRQEDDGLLFRPSGHGALLSNLNTIEADIVFIKNIDNVTVSKYKNEISFYKKVLAGHLLKIQKEVFKWLHVLDTEKVSDNVLNDIIEFVKAQLNIHFSEAFNHKPNSEKAQLLSQKLNRPLRVCGMVKNEGEPGGGPFWVKDDTGSISLQIVESSQIDFSNANQKNKFNKATHFNPVDLVCGIKNYKGEPFDLSLYTNPKTGFITSKTHQGKPIKALELPGLWNGSMANWNTIFIEVPLITFNPVKTVNDLLKPAHQTD